MTNTSIEMFTVVCDETNNSKESLEQGNLKIDVYIPQYYYSLNFIVNKDGSIEFDDKK